MNIIERLQASLTDGLRRSREVVETGPFECFFHPAEEMIYLNYAVCRSEPNAPDLEKLVQAFRERGRAPRFESFEQLWPTLGDLVLAHGFREEMRIPVMVLEPRNLIEPNQIEDVVPVESRELVQAQSRIASHAFGSPMPTEASVDHSWGQFQRGSQRAALIPGASSGVIVGSDEIVELAGVATIPEQRRKGYASAVSAWLCRDHFKRGGELVWLAAGDDAARSVYAQLGFEEVGTQVNYILDCG